MVLGIFQGCFEFFNIFFWNDEVEVLTSTPLFRTFHKSEVSPARLGAVSWQPTPWPTAASRLEAAPLEALSAPALPPPALPTV